MRISINLATRPFVELRPLFARLRLVMAALVIAAVALGFGLHAMSKKARVEEAQMRELKVETSVIENQRTANAQRMMEPQNRAVLERSKFLNELFASKSFSWTSVMMDLENVLPAGVQVTSIEPAINPDGSVNIQLRVAGPRELQVDLVRNLERSQRFVSPHVATETAQSEEQGRLLQTSGPGGVEFNIVSGYNPLPAPTSGAAKKELAQKEKASQGASSGAVHPAGKPARPPYRPSVKGGGR